MTDDAEVTPPGGETDGRRVVIVGSGGVLSKEALLALRQPIATTEGQDALETLEKAFDAERPSESERVPVPILMEPLLSPEPAPPHCARCDGLGKIVVSLDDWRSGNRAYRRKAKRRGYKAGRIACPSCQNNETSSP